MNTREEIEQALRDLQLRGLRVARRRGVGARAAHLVARRLGALTRGGPLHPGKPRGAGRAVTARSQAGVSALTNGRTAQRHGGSPQYGHSAPVARLSFA